MRTALIVPFVFLSQLASAQSLPRIEFGGGAATPAGGAAFDRAGFSARLTALASGDAGRLALRTDQSYAAPGKSLAAGGEGGDLTALLAGVEWRAIQAAKGLRPYAALGVGAASGYYGSAVAASDGRATGGALALAIGARRAVGRSIAGVEVGYAVYGPVRSTAMIPITMAVGF